jgi:hypothetical protein
VTKVVLLSPVDDGLGTSQGRQWLSGTGYLNPV